ncbi:hypothetical protein PoB_000725900 [Plakobranchus ocellatus]|uniref:Uncharacterized protein n=1 Tax=Plakobranchus ocellatus TaxID=259542 RepID=A0AAV3YFC2_9GAST|nr:hypothetical protein PoB_000725900 [Plakobranchus ocellatus]
MACMLQTSKVKSEPYFKLHNTLLSCFLQSENGHGSESDEDVISDNGDISFSDNSSDANEPDLTSLQPVDMTFLSNQVETAIVNEEPTPTSKATAMLEDVSRFYHAKDGNIWVKTTPPTGRNSSCNIFRHPVRQVTQEIFILLDQRTSAL